MRPCIHLKDESGIYMLFNSVNNKIYIGQTIDFYRRCHQYIYDYNTGRIGHLNDYLSRAMKKVGIENFDFIPLEFVDDRDELYARERHWIEHFNTLDRNYGYNLRVDEVEGLRHNSETSAKQSENLKKQWASGVRSGHSDKLKKNWENNPHRKEVQSALFSRYKTKYEYKIFNGDSKDTGDYQRLVELGITSVVSTYHRRKVNDAVCKGIRVIRYPLGESNETNE